MIAQGLVERLRLRGAPRSTPARSGSRTATRTAVRKRRRVSRRARIALLVTAVLAVFLGGAWTWFRDSSLVSVQRVTVSGQSGSDAGQISAALQSAARTMTTLDVQAGRLRRAVAPYPVVKDIRVTTNFPHAMHIEVIEQVAVGAIEADGRKVAVSADGTLLDDVAVSPSLPTIPMSLAPDGTAVTSGPASEAIKLLAAAPSALMPKISQVTTVAPHGLVAQVRGGPSIYFGDATDLSQKWIAASEILADPGSQGAVYIDVTDPQRAAAGAGSDGQSSSDTSATSSATSSSTGSATSSSTGSAASTAASTPSGSSQPSSTSTTGG